MSNYRDPAEEIARLGRQASVVAEAEDRAFRELGFPDSGRVLDLGCGPAAVAVRLARSRPGLEIVGVDRDPDVVSLARSHIEAVSADATNLPFDDSSFDFAYARLVFRHLSKPRVALRELMRVVRPGGGVILADSDDGTLVVNPEPVGFAEVMKARLMEYERRSGDPRMARRLHALLVTAGLEEVATRPVVVSSALIGAAAFAAIVLVPAADGIGEDLMSAGAVARVAEEIRAWGDRPESFGMTTAVISGGRLPGR